MTKIFLKKRNYQAFVKLENKDKLSIELKDLEFSVRAMNSLSNQGIKNLGELIVYTEHDLKSFPNMGRTSIEEIKNKLEDFSLYLGMNLDPANFEDNRNTEEPQNKEWTEVSRTLLLELIKDFNEIPLPLRAKNALLNLGCNFVGDIISLNKVTAWHRKLVSRGNPEAGHDHQGHDHQGHHQGLDHQGHDPHLFFIVDKIANFCAPQADKFFFLVSKIVKFCAPQADKIFSL